jgi:hypothetical protein
MNQGQETDGSKEDLAPSGSGETVLVPDLVRHSLRRLLARQWPDVESNGELRLALRDACDRARNAGLRAEQLLLVLKEAWYELSERQRLLGVDADSAALARVVTACIEEYYQGPRVRPELGRGGATSAGAGEGRLAHRTLRSVDGEQLSPPLRIPNDSHLTR